MQVSTAGPQPSPSLFRHSVCIAEKSGCITARIAKNRRSDAATCIPASLTSDIRPQKSNFPAERKTVIVTPIKAIPAALALRCGHLWSV